MREACLSLVSARNSLSLPTDSVKFGTAIPSRPCILTSHGCERASEALGRFAGSFCNSLLIKSLDSSVLSYHSVSSNSYSAFEIADMTLLSLAPLNGGYPQSMT